MNSNYFYPITRGEFAVVACKSGENTVKIIKNHLETICEERYSQFLDIGMDNLEKRVDYDLIMRQIQFINHVKRHHGIKIIERGDKRFGDGEYLPRLNESVSGKDVYVIQNSLDPNNPAQTNNNLVELFLELSTVKRAGAKNITVVLPYMSYSKQERKRGREPISAADIIRIIQTMGANRLITMDLHADAIQAFSDPNQMLVENFYASPLIMDYLRKKNVEVLVAPDPNAGKKLGYYQKVMGKPLALGYKFRSPDQVHEHDDQRLLGDVKGMVVGIVDDQSAGSKTLRDMAKICYESGAKEIYAAVTTGMFLGDAENNFRESVKLGHLTGMAITNTLIHDEDLFKRNKSFLEQLDALKILSEAIFGIHVDDSLSRLYKPELTKAYFGEHHRT